MLTQQEALELSKNDILRKETFQKLRVDARPSHLESLPPRRVKPPLRKPQLNIDPSEILVKPTISATVYKKKTSSPTKLPKPNYVRVPIHP